MSISAQLAPVIAARGLVIHGAGIAIIEHALDARVPVDTGATRHSRRAVTRPAPTSISTEISYDTPQAEITDKGPKAHVIRAHGKALRFVGSGGTVVYRRQVNWRPGAGVARNKGWFSDTVTDSAWRAALGAATGLA